MLPVSPVPICGVLRITCIFCTQRYKLFCQFKNCILPGINITASKILEESEYYLIVLAELVSIL
jgi:hypothetical protein